MTVPISPIVTDNRWAGTCKSLVSGWILMLFAYGARSRTRTHRLLSTKQVLYQMSYTGETGLLSVYLLARQRLRQQIFRLIKMHPWRNNLFLQRCTPVHSFSSLELGGWSSRYGIEPSSASMKKQPLHPRWGKNPCSKSRNPRRFFFFTSNVKQRILYSYIVAGWHSFVNSYFCTLTKECTNLQFGTLAWYPQTQRCLLWYPT